MQAKFYLLNLIFVLLMLSSVGARRKKNCSKYYKGTLSKRFRARLQSCINEDNKPRRCKKIQKKEACRKLIDSQRKNKGLSFYTYAINKTL